MFFFKANCLYLLPPSPILNLSVLIGQSSPTLILKSIMLWYLKGFLVYHLKFSTAHSLIVLSVKMFLTPIVNTLCSPCLPVFLNAFLQFPLPPLGSLLAGLIPLSIFREQPIFGINYGTMLVVHHQVYYFAKYKEEV